MDSPTQVSLLNAWASARMSRRRLLQLGAVGAGTAVLAACTRGAERPRATTTGAGRPTGTATIVYGAIAGDGFHPIDHESTVERDIANLIFDPLITLSSDLEIIPVLAENFEVVDPTTYRFTLRPGIRFHDGSELTAEDAKTSLESFIHPAGAEGSTIFSYTPWFDSVEIRDELSFDVLTKVPVRTGLAAMAADSLIFPAEYFPPDISETPPGSGPYRFVESNPNQSVVEANPDYWGETKPFFEQIIFRAIPEDATRVAALEAGEVDFIADVLPDSISRLESAGLVVESIPSLRSMYANFNFEIDGPWQDIRVRKALNHAVDREALNEAIFGGTAAVSIAPEPALTPFTPQDLAPYPYDVDMARTLLAEAGFPDGFDGGTFIAPAGRYLKDRETAEAIHGFLAEIGVNYSLQTSEFTVFSEEAPSAELGLAAWSNITGDPGFGVTRQLSCACSPWTPGGVPRETTNLLEQASSTYVPEEYGPLYDEAERLFWDFAPRIFALDLPMIYAHAPDLQGVNPNPTTHYSWRDLSRA